MTKTQRRVPLKSSFPYCQEKLGENEVAIPKSSDISYKQLQIDNERLSKMVEILRRTVQSKEEEIENKNLTINNLIQDSLTAVSNIIHQENAEGNITEDLDIEGLFDEDLGAVEFDDFLNISGCSNILQTDLTVNNIFDTLEEQPELKVDEGRSNNNDNEEKTVVASSSKDPSIIQVLVEQSKNVASVKEIVSPSRVVEDKEEKSKRKRETDSTPSLSKKRKTEVKSLHCPHCDKQFPLGGSWKLKKHISRQHANQECKDKDTDENFSCSQCPEKFDKESVFHSHMLKHRTRGKWSCKVCKNKYEKMLDLVQHAKHKHGLLNSDEAIEKLV